MERRCRVTPRRDRSTEGPVPRAARPRDAPAEAGAGVVLLHRRGGGGAVNAAGLRMLGVPAARAKGRPGAELLRTPVAGDDPVREAFRAARGEREAVLLTPGGAELPVLLRSRRIGRPPWAAILFRDLTQTRRLQQELGGHQPLAPLGQLAAGVAHEIRNPLAGIGTSAQVLLRRFEPRDERSRFVRVILEEVSRLDRIVTSLLQYARPRAPELRRSVLSRCIDRVVELSADAVGQARV